LYAGSKSRVRARRSGLVVLGTAEAARRGDVVFLALSDTQMPEIYAQQIAQHLRPGQRLLFAHGFAIHYRTIVPRKDVNVIMVAPKGLGPMVRREFRRGCGAPGLMDSSKPKQARQANCVGMGKGNRLHPRGYAGDHFSR